MLINIDPWFKRPYGKKVALQPFKTHSGFNTTKGNAGIIYHQFKLLTGDPGNPEYSPTYNPSIIKFTSRESHENTQSVRLYNIQDDPFEKTDISTEHPDLVEYLLNRLNYYNSTFIQPRFPPCDAACDPSIRNGFWGPFQT